MDCRRAVGVLALALCALGLLEFAPGFASAATGRAGAVHGVAAPASPRPGADAWAVGGLQLRGGAGAGLRAAATALVLGALGAAVRSGGRAAGASRRPRTQARADASGLSASGPITVYTRALMDAAAKQKESVPVTKDVMKIKALFGDEDFLDELTLVVNETGQTELDKARGMLKLMQPLESKVMEKFVIFLAKKRRLLALKPICHEFVCSLYDAQSIAPVVVRSAQRLTSEQIKNITDKMKAKTGASDIKLVTEVDASLLGGFIIEWGFTDPENLNTPTEGIDLSLKNYLKKSAINQGVITEI
mmetsp:Transcript_56696/g.156940  ORF Transcript_56696/g.156940 Transcript_56696/m.156940 type:complete len:304 (+) Transcript_56696:91-1002(+)